MKKINFIAGLLSFSLLFVACSGKNAKNEPVQKEKIGVRSEKISPVTLRSYIELNGGIEAKNSVKVYPNIAGKIAGTRVDLGSYVNKGDVLLLVDPSTPGSQYALSRVTSPISGNVVSIPPRTGTQVSTETDVVTIGDLSKLQIRAYVPEKFFAALKSGLACQVKVESSEKVFASHVERVSPVVDEASRTCEVIIGFDGDYSEITAGMFSKIRLYLKDYENVLAMSENCVVEREGKKTVFVLSDGKAVAREVSLGVSVDSVVEIKSGLSEGDFVITEGLSSVQDGSEVSVVE